MNRSKTHQHKKYSECEVPKTKTRELRKMKEKQIQHVQNTITTNTHLIEEAPPRARGCLSFFLSHSSSSSSTTTTTTTSRTPLNRNCPSTTKTPNSSRLPHSEPFPFINHNSSSNPISHKLYPVKKSQSSQKPPTSETPASLDSNNIASVIESLSVSSQRLLKLPEAEEEEPHFTPVAVSKIATCSALDCLVNKNMIMDDDKSNTSSSNTKTPPIQASFSPEIQSTTTTDTTFACYAAGHIISGVTDRRKCRARGVLAVALPPPAHNDHMSTHNSNSNPQEDYATGFVNKSSAFMLPSPAEASMHWLSSPCHEDDKENSAPFNTLLQHKSKTIPSPSSPLSDLGFSFDCCYLSDNTSDATNSCIANSQRNTNNMLISTQFPQFQVRLDSLCDYAFVSYSPNDTPYSRAVPLKEEANHSYNIDGGNSPFSADTLGSENVIQTPNSDSSLERRVGLSCSSAKDHKRHHFHSELLSVAGDLRTASLSPNSHVSIRDTTSSSFQFDGLTTPSNSMDLSHFQKILDDQSYWTSNSTFENVSQSQMRISWREGLVSRIFEMDEFDRCRCLSDEEEDLNINSSDPFKSCQNPEINVDVGKVPTLTNACGSTEFLDGESKEKLRSPVQCSYAESISTDGGGLARSEDSDWNLCYKNNLFEV
ncbi:hypothetical protein REPUB_Repub02eG0289600 [Reevesia pubescens]